MKRPNQNPKLGRMPIQRKFTRYDDCCPNPKCGERIGWKRLIKLFVARGTMVDVKSQVLLTECPHCSKPIQIEMSIDFGIKEVEW